MSATLGVRLKELEPSLEYRALRNPRRSAGRELGCLAQCGHRPCRGTWVRIRLRIL